MANEVRIKLTDEQKAKIKEATGKEMPEIRVGNLGENPAVSANTFVARTVHPTRASNAISARASLQSTKPAIAARATRSHRLLAAKAAKSAKVMRAAKAAKSAKVMRAAKAAKSAKVMRAAKAAKAFKAFKAAKSTKAFRSTPSSQ